MSSFKLKDHMIGHCPLESKLYSQLDQDSLMSGFEGSKIKTISSQTELSRDY